MTRVLPPVKLGPNSPLLTKSGRARRFGPTEHQIQAAYITAIGYKIAAIPDLATLHAVPNSVGRDKATQAKRKAEGVVPGMPDIHWPVSRGPFVGLWIEFKRPGIKVPEYQYEVHQQLRAQGHAVIVCDEVDHAFDVTLRYDALGPGHRSGAATLAVEESRLRGW